MWRLTGTPRQNLIIREALTQCDFPFSRLKPSLAKEGKKYIDVIWKDLSEQSKQLEAAAEANEHVHIHEGDKQASPVQREVEGRMVTLGLFYLPPHTRIVLDKTLVNDPLLAKEVFLAEAAHAVDYHYMTNEHRRVFWNAVHVSSQDLPPGTIVHESGDIHHGHSWFDGEAGYDTWVGEAFMEGFIEAFAPTIPVTIQLKHPVTKLAAKITRDTLLGKYDKL